MSLVNSMIKKKKIQTNICGTRWNELNFDERLQLVLQSSVTKKTTNTSIFGSSPNVSYLCHKFVITKGHITQCVPNSSGMHKCLSKAALNFSVEREKNRQEIEDNSCLPTSFSLSRCMVPIFLFIILNNRIDLNKK